MNLIHEHELSPLPTITMTMINLHREEREKICGKEGERERVIGKKKERERQRRKKKKGEEKKRESDRR